MVMIQSMMRKNFTEFYLLLVAGGFFAVLVELIMSNHMGGSQMVGVYSTLLGGLLAIHAAIDGRARSVLAVLFVVLSLFGLIGAYEHRHTRQTKEALATFQNIQAHETAAPERIISPPYMAPLSLAGLSMFAVLMLLTAPRKSEFAESA